MSDHLRSKKVEFPWHASAFESLQLEISIDLNQMTQFSEAFMVHPPDELPMMFEKHNIFEFAGGRSLEVLITPSVIKSDESLKALEPSDRLCYFEGERKLRFFKVYTKRNCEIECFSNFTREKCNCVQFDIVRDTDTKVCGIEEEDIDCVFDSESLFNYTLAAGNFGSCSCFSLCNSISYNFEIRELLLQNNE